MGLESTYLDSTIRSIQSVLQRQTEGRVPVFSHEVVPDHLRTKPDPEVEEQEKQLTTDAARIGADAAQVGLSHCSAAPSLSFIRSKTLPSLCSREMGLFIARLLLEEHRKMLPQNHY